MEERVKILVFSPAKYYRRTIGVFSLNDFCAPFKMVGTEIVFRGRQAAWDRNMWLAIKLNYSSVLL